MSEGAFVLTRHAEERLRQRGLRESDIEFVLGCGTATAECVLLTDKDVAREIDECRRRIARLERLRGLAVFVAESVVVTIFRPDRVQARRLLGRQPTMHRVRPQRHSRGKNSSGPRMAFAASAP